MIVRGLLEKSVCENVAERADRRVASLIEILEIDVMLDTRSDRERDSGGSDFVKAAQSFVTVRIIDFETPVLGFPELSN